MVLVYGLGRSGTHGSLTYKPFDREGFLADLAAAKAVLATAGFTLMTESLYLKKPLLALPMKGQFEQELNAFLLEHRGYGKNLRRVSHRAIKDFLANLSEYERALGAYQADDNHAILKKLDELLDLDAALLKQFQKSRRGFMNKTVIKNSARNRSREEP